MHATCRGRFRAPVSIPRSSQPSSTGCKADVEKGRFPGAVVLVMRDGQVLLHEAVGWADKDKKVPMARDSIHPIASSTKLITTVAALRLFEQNKLPMMAPIATYLPELKDLKIAVARATPPATSPPSWLRRRASRPCTT